MYLTRLQCSLDERSEEAGLGYRGVRRQLARRVKLLRILSNFHVFFRTEAFLCPDTSSSFAFFFVSTIAAWANITKILCQTQGECTEIE